MYKISAKLALFHPIYLNFPHQMGRFNLIVVLSLSLSLCLFPNTISAALQKNYYANVCPNVENIVRDAVTKKFSQTFVTVPATIRLFFHDCFVQVNIYYIQ
jgi:peroxidase